MLEAAIAVADELLVISCARSLNRLSGGSLGIFQLLQFFYYLTDSVFLVSVTVSVIFFLFFSVTVIVTVNWIIIFQLFYHFSYSYRYNTAYGTDLSRPVFSGWHCARGPAPVRGPAPRC